MLQQPSNIELWIAFGINVVITLIYLGVVLWTGSIPAASDVFGHSLGIIGFILMLMTETLYSLRKRARKARWGRTSWWLKFHIVTGLVGSYMVLLHSAWKFQGLAGVLMLLVGIVVLSGFIGRYIYTAIPRTAEGYVAQEQMLEAEMRKVEAEINRWLAARDEATRRLALNLERLAEAHAGRSWWLLWGRWLDELRYRWEWWKEVRHVHRQARREFRQLERLLARQRQLRRQRQMAALARRALAWWHAFHVPLGMAMFTLAFIHICAALYYATLMK